MVRVCVLLLLAFFCLGLSLGGFPIAMISDNRVKFIAHHLIYSLGSPCLLTLICFRGLLSVLINFQAAFSCGALSFPALLVLVLFIPFIGLLLGLSPSYRIQLYHVHGHSSFCVSLSCQADIDLPSVHKSS
jgi:hypothetical protein